MIVSVLAVSLLLLVYATFTGLTLWAAVLAFGIARRQRNQSLLDDVSDEALHVWKDDKQWGRWPHPIDDRDRLSALRAQAYASAAEGRVLGGKLMLAAIAIGVAVVGSQVILRYIQHWHLGATWADTGSVVAVIGTVMMLERFRFNLERWQTRAKMYRELALELEEDENKSAERRRRPGVRHRRQRR